MPLTFPTIMLLSFLLYPKSFLEKCTLITSLHFTSHPLICFWLLSRNQYSLFQGLSFLTNSNVCSSSSPSWTRCYSKQVWILLPTPPQFLKHLNSRFLNKKLQDHSSDYTIFLFSVGIPKACWFSLLSLDRFTYTDGLSDHIHVVDPQILVFNPDLKGAF